MKFAVLALLSVVSAGATLGDGDDCSSTEEDADTCGEDFACCTLGDDWEGSGASGDVVCLGADDQEKDGADCSAGDADGAMKLGVSAVAALLLPCTCEVPHDALRMFSTK